jgi:hypothetical protein
MGAANDEKILELKNKIQEKKDKIGKTKFVPVTHCSIELDGTRYNLQVLGNEQLTFMLIKLNAFQMSMDNLGIKTCNICGYTVQDWIADIKLKLEVIAQKTEESSLKVLENKLSTLLSEDKKTELELGAIAELLK